MGRHTLIELVLAIAGLALTLGITWAAARAYPLGRDTIWLVGWVAFAGVAVFNGFGLRAAWRRDRDAA